jgi:phosphatidylglycerol:prolipoprotein diacylglycerol transferase
MCEVINSAFPLAWVFGRMGCSTVHDHPGMLSDAWYAVKWPMGFGHGTVGRLDLGLIEMILTIPLAIAYAALWRRKPMRPNGLYIGLMCVAYAPVRFLLDFLRVDETEIAGSGDRRYAGLTPAQWACFGLLALGLYFLRMWKRARDTEVIDEASTPDDAAASEGTAATAAAPIEEETVGPPPGSGSDEAPTKIAAPDADEAPTTVHEPSATGGGGTGTSA